jgi:eukaryotic-like serine/threonine-protein kinase
MTESPLSRFVLDGRWRLRRQLAFGADGTVYLATDEQTGEDVAVKIYDARSSVAAAVELGRVATEAEVSQSVSSPYLVRVLHYGLASSADGAPSGYVVMEYLEGETLRSWLEARPGGLAPSDANTLIKRVLAALAALHDAGFVHGDLKPENIWVLAGGGGEDFAIKLLDLGEVAPVGFSSRDGARGTPLYVAPEVARRTPTVTPAADVYSAAVLWFELLMGRPPVDATMTPEQLVAQHVFGALDALPEQVEQLPVGAVYARATSREPGERYASARGMLDAIRLLRPQKISRLPALSPFSDASVNDSVEVPVQRTDE